MNIANCVRWCGGTLHFFTVVIHCLNYVILNNVLCVATLCACKLFEGNNVQ